MKITAVDLAKHGIRKSGHAYMKDNQRLTLAEVQELLGIVTTAPEKKISIQSSADSWNFEKLNAATQAFFYALCEQIQSATKDASMELGVKIGKDIPSIGLSNAPRLTNLKKAGVFAHGGKGWLQLTERGRAIFLATV